MSARPSAAEAFTVAVERSRLRTWSHPLLVASRSPARRGRLVAEWREQTPAVRWLDVDGRDPTGSLRAELGADDSFTVAYDLQDALRGELERVPSGEVLILHLKDIHRASADDVWHLLAACQRLGGSGDLPLVVIATGPPSTRRTLYAARPNSERMWEQFRLDG